MCVVIDDVFCVVGGVAIFDMSVFRLLLLPICCFGVFLVFDVSVVVCLYVCCLCCCRCC